MKRFSVMLLALVFVVAFTVPAMAIHIGSAGTSTPDTGLSVSGTYKIDGESNDSNTGAKKRFYDDDFEMVLRAYMGDVTATVDFEISDNSDFTPPTTRSADIVDNYYVQWKANDALAFKIGEYGVSFGSTEGYYSQGHQQIGATYALDNVTLGLYMAKITEGGEDDANQFALTVNTKDIGTFTKLNFIYGTFTDDTTAATPDASFIGVDAALPIGPVSLAVEYGSLSDDKTADGSYYLIGVGLTDLVNMDKLGLTFHVYNADEDFSARFTNGNYDAMSIYTVKTNDLANDVTLYWLSGTYAYTDKLTLSFAFGSGSEGTGVERKSDGTVARNSVDGSIGTEIDLGGSYKLADNVTYQAAIASWSPGSDFAVSAGGPGDDGYTKLFHRLTFKF